MSAAQTDLGARFLAQNRLCAEGLTAEDVDQIDAYAEHHAGGLIVLFAGPLDDGICVKAHDSWGDDGSVVVHSYDPDDDERDEVSEYPTGHEAISAFLAALGETR